MCKNDLFDTKVDEIEAYLEFVNTDIDKLMMFNIELYAAYAAHNELPVGTIKDWYGDAEECFITALDIDLYLMTKYGVHKDEDVEYFYELEVNRNGTLYECAGYWFTKE